MKRWWENFYCQEKEADKILIYGGQPLQGKITVSGAKNAVLPIIVASLLAEGTCTIYDVPHLADVEIICDVLRELGAEIKFNSKVNTSAAVRK